MSAGNTAIKACGYAMTLFGDGCPQGTEFIGLLQPLQPNDTDSLHIAALPGGVKKAKFLLIAEPAAPFEGQSGVTVHCRGLVYELLRADPMYLGGSLSHWECVMRLRGEAEA